MRTTSAELSTAQLASLWSTACASSPNALQDSSGERTAATPSVRKGSPKSMESVSEQPVLLTSLWTQPLRNASELAAPTAMNSRTDHATCTSVLISISSKMESASESPARQSTL
jgi:hypothetical protein